MWCRQFVKFLSHQSPDSIQTQTSKHLLIKNRDTYEIRMQALKLLYLSLSWNGGFCFKFTNYKSRVIYRNIQCSVGILLKYYCYSKMYKCVGPSEVISSKQKKIEIKIEINMLSKTNKYKTKQTNSKKNIKKKEKNPNINTTFIDLT